VTQGTPCCRVSFRSDFCAVVVALGRPCDRARVCARDRCVCGWHRALLSSLVLNSTSDPFCSPLYCTLAPVLAITRPYVLPPPPHFLGSAKPRKPLPTPRYGRYIPEGSPPRTPGSPPPGSPAASSSRRRRIQPRLPSGSLRCRSTTSRTPVAPRAAGEEAQAAVAGRRRRARRGGTTGRPTGTWGGQRLPREGMGKGRGQVEREGWTGRRGGSGKDSRWRTPEERWGTSEKR